MRKIYAVGSILGTYIKYYCLNFFYQTNTILKISEDFYPQINEFEKESFAFNIIFAERRDKNLRCHFDQRFGIRLPNLKLKS